ncbi:MAG: hypothetical protein EHM58_07435 [Ignavibacteriae bacterium]|nr:MAG: hypothetical protein EHM58_07435 [Ignavibacteriota bacterium]
MKAYNSVSLPVNITFPEYRVALSYRPSNLIFLLEEKIIKLLSSYKDAVVNNALSNLSSNQKFDIQEKSLYMYKIIQPFL